MKKLIFLAMLVSLGAQAKTNMNMKAKAKMVDFDCVSEDGHQLQFSLRNKLITTPIDHPKRANIEFTLDGRAYQWDDTELMTMQVTEGEYGSFFKKSPGNDFYVQHVDQSEIATSEITVDRNYYAFDCQKKVRK